jgi:hypothetical protein
MATRVPTRATQPGSTVSWQEEIRRACLRWQARQCRTAPTRVTDVALRSAFRAVREAVLDTLPDDPTDSSFQRSIVLIDATLEPLPRESVDEQPMKAAITAGAWLHILGLLEERAVTRRLRLNPPTPRPGKPKVDHFFTDIRKIREFFASRPGDAQVHVSPLMIRGVLLAPRHRPLSKQELEALFPTRRGSRRLADRMLDKLQRTTAPRKTHN